MTDVSSAPVFSTWERHVGTELGKVRLQLQRALREQNFTLLGDTLTSIEAVRGSQIAAFVLQHDNLPMTAHIRLHPLDNACTVSVQLEETGKVPSRYLGVRGAYQRGFAEVQSHLDDALAELDPTMEREAVNMSPAGDPNSFGEQLGTAAGSIGKAVVHGANRILEGRDTSTPTAWKELDDVTFLSPDGYASLSVERVQGMLVVAGLVASQPGSMPTNLAHDVELFAAKLESTLDSSQGADWTSISVSPEEVPVVGFLASQALIRESLPLRTLHICTVCRQEKVTNPDYEKMVERHRKLRNITSAFGATVGRKGVTPFVIVGQLVRIKKLDPDYVCSRCQSITADEFVVTFCPQCGDRRQEAVLRACTKCKYDFRRELGGAKELWHPGAPPLPPAPAVYATGTTPGALPGPASYTATPGAAAPYPSAPGAAAPYPSAPGVLPYQSGVGYQSGVSYQAPGGIPGAVPPYPGQVAPNAAGAVAATPPAAGEPAPYDSQVLYPASGQAPPAGPSTSPAAPDLNPLGGPAAPTTAAPTASAGQPAEVAPLPLPPPSWYPDPYARHAQRWWDGQLWTQYVSDGGPTSTDPV
ncbi:MAG TPA: DUF2510 domain-containing protein [Acidimicrobiales bacterium]|nr:DUF2510 domain-containing protein [Acidimicrobiales bacterium]